MVVYLTIFRNFSCPTATTIGPPPNSFKDSLPTCIDWSGITLLFPCARCACLDKQYIKLKISKCYSKCVHFGHYPCAEISSSNLTWKKLLATQEKICSARQKALEEVATTTAWLTWLEKQDNLLQKQAGKFLQTDIHDIEELEQLEEEELCQRKDAEHSAHLATTTETIPFGSPTANPLSKSQLNEILA
jgi:hypothetical protein